MGMLNYSGSIRYSMNGKKRKTVSLTPKKKKLDFKSTPQYKRVVAKQEKQYKSLMEEMIKAGTFSSVSNGCAKVDNSWKIEESKNYAIAPAYNKGAYQVVPKSDLKFIGK
jgi:endonuclease YncB( thermonuclease family)|tara:strand:- start:3792 stop:4121 length:330 start_codon:yes stop_codon:yes gene_type:complete